LKRFWQSQGGVATFYGADVMDDPAVTSGEAQLVIVEGELDKLSVETAGHPFVVSVPEGAPPPPRPDRMRRGEPSAADDMTGKFRFMFNNRDRLQAVKRFILAVDDDAAGRCLENEIIRRILVPRCARVKYPEGCKDFNDVLMKHGKDAVLEVYARPRRPSRRPHNLAQVRCWSNRTWPSFRLLLLGVLTVLPVLQNSSRIDLGS
jgi:twinkle protein